MIELLRVLLVHDAVFECDDCVRQGTVWQGTCKMTVLQNDSGGRAQENPHS